MDGVININKPAGWTSQDVCAKLRSLTHIKKTGHTGTLDPMATGVLPVCTGKATRVIEYYDRDIKSYRACMKLGVTSDTLDITGEVVTAGDHTKVSEKSVRNAFEAYTGLITQVPPKYSALRINGKRAYDLARRGEDFEMKGREITIYKNEVLSFDPSEGIIEFDVSCSKGTYIRTICDDIGRILGCGAVMTALCRTGTGCFSIEDAVDFEELIVKCDKVREEGGDSADIVKNLLVPADRTLVMLGRIELPDKRISAFLNGNSSRQGSYRITEESRFDSIYRVYAQGSGGAFLGTAAVEKGALVPQKVFR